LIFLLRFVVSLKHDRVMDGLAYDYLLMQLLDQ